MAAAIFEILPVWNSEGNNEFHLLDFGDRTFDVETIEKVSPLEQAWSTPKLQIVEAGRNADIYYGIGHHFFFSDRARHVVAPLSEGFVEWLPVHSDRLGKHYLLHPLRQVPLGSGSKFRCNSVSKNMTVIDEYVFDIDAIGAVSIFYPSQASGSAAAQAGYCFPAVLVADVVMTALVNNKLSGIQGVLR